jgi:hypothetical protein
MTTSPTQRSLKWLRQRGFTAAITERWNPHAKLRQDLFGFIDIVALSSICGIVAVQTTSGPNMAARISKIRDLLAAKVWLDAGGMIIVHGWRKVGARGKRKLWECREVRLELRYGEIWEVQP